MAAEHAAICMQLVDHHEAQVLEELRPARMVRQDAGVQHVGVAEHHVRLAADRAARVRWCVPIVGEDTNLELGVAAHELGERVQLGELILSERLGRKEIQRARRRILQDRVEDRRVVAERLARCRRRDGHHVAPAEHVRKRLRLMGVELANPARGERADEAVVGALRDMAQRPPTLPEVAEPPSRSDPPVPHRAEGSTSTD